MCTPVVRSLENKFVYRGPELSSKDLPRHLNEASSAGATFPFREIVLRSCESTDAIQNPLLDMELKTPLLLRRL